MKKIIAILVLVFVGGFCVAFAEPVLRGSVSMAERVPADFFGTWRVTSKMVQTNARQTFKPNTADLWTLSKNNGIIKLENPFTGASAEISVQTASGNLVKFTKTGKYENKVLTDTVQIRITGNSFTGYNDLTLETLSITDQHVLKTEKAKYMLRGEKIAGQSVK